MNAAQWLAVGLIRLYQLVLSPFTGGACRFVPSCSAYAIDAVRQHGALTGVILGVRRLARCHPFGGWGLDPVPERRSSSRN
jgi:putative membrane protein insertion efficiency factor